jgi:hypothetical protein
MRFLLVEAGQTAVRGDVELRRAYARLAAKKSRAVAKVMVARRHRGGGSPTHRLACIAGGMILFLRTVKD